MPLVLLSIPVAVGIHTVTAFLYNGLAARPYWNASILAPRFLASAFCSGPAILLILLQILRRFTRFEIKDEAIWKIAELMAYAMFLNLFLLGAEIFKEYYSDTEHLLFTRYWYFGLGEHRTLVPYAWSAVFAEPGGVRLFIFADGAAQLADAQPRLPGDLRRRLHREGHGAGHPGPDAGHARRDLRVHPTLAELRVAAGIFAVGFLVFTLMLKVAVPISLGEFLDKKQPELAGAGAFARGVRDGGWGWGISQV